MNLTLDGDELPLSHAPGGDGDIIAKYSNFDVMLEATLMDKNAQKRGELEPVIRHTVNLTIKNKLNNRDTFTFFVADELDTNVVNIFRATSNIELESSQDRNNFTNGIKIYSLSINQIVYLLEKGINYKQLIENIFSEYNKIIPIKQNWHKEAWQNVTRFIK